MIDQHNNGIGLAAISVHGMVSLFGEGASTLRNNDLTLFQEFVARGHCFGKQATRVTAQIENEPLEVWAKAVESIRYLAAGGFLELG